ncbi:hypothetical protein OAD50_04525 [Vicingaceae bacterium]|nr:hypothetical protein [Vicingaceae bacterium]
MVELRIDTIFDRSAFTQNQIGTSDSIEFAQNIPIYSPMDLGYFGFDNELCDEASILRIAFFCHNIITNGDDSEMNTSEEEIANTPLDSVIKYFNTNKWIGQCAKYDEFAKNIYAKYGYKTITVNPLLFGKTDSLGHIYTIVYSPYSKTYYPIDIQNNCYWRLDDGQIADFKSIIIGVNYSREYIDTINGRKNIKSSSLNYTPLIFKLDRKVQVISLQGTNKTFKDIKYNSFSKSGTNFIYRSIIKPAEDIRPNNYMYRTSKKINTESPSWEDFIFNAGILTDNGEIKKRLFYGDD